MQAVAQHALCTMYGGAGPCNYAHAPAPPYIYRVRTKESLLVNAWTTCCIRKSRSGVIFTTFQSNCGFPIDTMAPETDNPMFAGQQPVPPATSTSYPKFVVDLDLPPRQRWAEVAKAYKPTAHRLLAAYKQVSCQPTLTLHTPYKGISGCIVRPGAAVTAFVSGRPKTPPLSEALAPMHAARAPAISVHPVAA